MTPDDPRRDAPTPPSSSAARTPEAPDPSMPDDVLPPPLPGEDGFDDDLEAGHEPYHPETSYEIVPHPAASIPEAKEETRRRARDVRDIIARYVRQHLPPQQPSMPVAEQPPRMVGAHARLLPVLRLIPATLIALFVLSFFWDFPGQSFVLFGRLFPLEGLLRILAVSGLIGFATNWLAITMLFNPREKRPIFGQGLIPAQRERVIFRLAKAVSEELINEEIIKAKIEESGVIPRYRELFLDVTRGVIEDPDFRREIKGVAADYAENVLSSPPVKQRLFELAVDKIEQYAGEGFGGLALRTYRYLNEEDFQRRIEQAIHELPQNVDVALDEMDGMLDRVPAMIEARSEEIEAWATRIVLGFVEKLDVYSMIMSNMHAYDEQQLENLLKKTSNEQLNYIKYLGGILGAVGGLVIWQPLPALAVFAALGAILYGLDVALYRAKAS